MQSHARSLLAAAVEAVQPAHSLSESSHGAQKEHNSDTAVQEQHRQAVVWLLRAAPAVAAAAPTADLLSNIPSVQIGWSLQLVAAGVRIRYAQLLAAARSMVAGVEVWVQAQQQLGIQTDIPELAVAVCSKYDEENPRFWLWLVGPTAVFLYVSGHGLECTLCMGLQLRHIRGIHQVAQTG
jgi:hypothetical protein